jgi:hypothetical protein
MQTKLIIFFLLLFAACGRDVKFTNQLESSSAVTQAQPIVATQTASIVRSVASPPGAIIMNGRTYNISPFSSYLALKFINAQPVGVSVAVRVTGEVKGQEVYIKVIE